MPEGDVVWYTARRLHEALAGRVLTRSDFRVPRLATADLSGDVVSETVSRGKHLLTRTKNGLTVHTHLKMDGSRSVRPAAERLREANKERFGHITTGSMRRGEEHWVYGRRGKPCRRCGTPVRAAGQDDRVTFWCPSCQPG